jgi:uncharacterized membrane protein YedE/YeeE
MFSIDWAHFTPGSAALGGAMIGASAGAMALIGGKIAGISGIFGGALSEAMQGKRPLPWRLWFLGGLVCASFLWVLFRPVPGAHYGESWPLIAAGGLIVGFGTRLGSGCASGHGVCGLARFSPRSMAAVTTFIGMGMVTTFVMRHLLGGA